MFANSFNRLARKVRGQQKKKSSRSGYSPRSNRLSVESLEDRRMMAVLSAGTGDGSVTVDVDGYGAFGSAQGGSAPDGAKIDLAGVNGPTKTVFQSHLFIGLGDWRLWISDRELDEVDVDVSVDGRTATSTFELDNLPSEFETLEGMEVELVQSLTPFYDGVTQVGALLSQTYNLVNSTGAAIDFDIVRYMDADNVNVASSDGGGKVNFNGGEWLVTTSSAAVSDLTDPDLYVAISANGGQLPTTNRYQVAEFPYLRLDISDGEDLTDDVLLDSDNDGLIDVATYDVTGGLRRTYSMAPSASARFTTYTIFAEGVPLDSFAPQVSNVAISSTISNAYGTNPAYSFDTVDGSEEQLRTVPVGGANRISVQFNEEVSLVSADLELIALNRVVTEPTPTLVQSPTLANNFTAIWSLSGALPAAQFLLRLSDTIVDNDGVQLDGEWTNPASILSSASTSTFPSGDGFAGGDFEFIFTIMPGDANRDNQVDLSDLAVLGANYPPNPNTNRSWSQADWSGDGVVDISDLSLLGGTYGKDFTSLNILGNYIFGYVLTSADETAFLSYYGTNNSAADLNQDSTVTSADYDAFYELYNFGIDLDVV